MYSKHEKLTPYRHLIPQETLRKCEVSRDEDSAKWWISQQYYLMDLSLSERNQSPIDMLNLILNNFRID